MSLRLARGVSVLALILSAVWCLPPVRSQAPPRIDPAKSLIVKTVTIQGKLRLSQVLDQVRGQTGVDVVKAVPQDPELDLTGLRALQKVPFWQALDEIAKAADLRLSLYLKGGKMGFISGPYRELPTSYSGPFRVTLKRLLTSQDFDADARTMIADLEVAWMPPFQPFFLEIKPNALVLQDDKGTPQDLPKMGRVPGFVGDEHYATEIKVQLPALRRQVPRIGLFKGSLTMVGSAKMLNFTFDKLEKNQEKAQEGVTVKMTNFEIKKDDDIWVIELNLKYPPSPVESGSWQMGAWLVRNKALLVSKRPNGPRYEPNANSDSEDISPTQTVVRYRYAEDPDNKVLLGKKSADWKFEYHTAGPILEVPIPFEFKDVPLP